MLKGGDDDIQVIERDDGFPDLSDPNYFIPDPYGPESQLVPYNYGDYTQPMPPPATGPSPQKRPHSKMQAPPPAATKKRPAKARQPFVMKLWLMVNDPANSQYIRWTPDGLLFEVVRREEFTNKMLPKYFKHHKFSSFVRQLNMYGWHKVQDVTLNLFQDKLDEVLVFNNPNFIRGREDLLDNIVRNRGTDQPETTQPQLPPGMLLEVVLNDLNQLRCNQVALLEELQRLRKDNKALWQENYHVREQNREQGQTVEKILKFLSAVYANNSKAIDDKPRLMLTDQGHRPSDNSLIEEIIRNYDSLPGLTPQLPHANKLYQQLMSGDNLWLQPDLHTPQYNPPPQQLNGNNMVVPLPKTYEPFYDNDMLIPPHIPDNVDTKVQMQGQSLQQVQDWILKLAEQQQDSEQDHLQPHDHQPEPPKLEDFNVDDFLAQPPLPDTQMDNQEQPTKRRKIRELD